MAWQRPQKSIKLVNTTDGPIVPCNHGRKLLGDTGDVSPHFFRRGDIICHVPPLCSLRVCIWRGLKTKCDVCHVLCEEFVILDLTHSYVDVETEFGVVSLILIYLWIFTSKTIFSIFQVSIDRKRLLTASVRRLFNVVYCNKDHCLETVKFNDCTRERHQYNRDLFRTKTLANWLYCNVGCHVFRNRQSKI